MAYGSSATGGEDGREDFWRGEERRGEDNTADVCLFVCLFV